MTDGGRRSEEETARGGLISASGLGGGGGKLFLHFPRRRGGLGGELSTLCGWMSTALTGRLFLLPGTRPRPRVPFTGVVGAVGGATVDTEGGEV